MDGEQRKAKGKRNQQPVAHAATMPLETGDPAAPSLPTFGRGDRLADRYRIIRLLAEGGMGEVYEAEDEVLHERLALKTVRKNIAHDDKTFERFKREIHLARKVTHPNVCRIFDVGFHDGGAFLTMELYDGETLADRLRKGRVDVVLARRLIAQLASGLGAAHKAGVIHRDFKSANVLLVPDGDHVRAVISDFGLARGTEEGSPVLSGHGGIVGTAAYMAPEQVRGGEVTLAADIYAFGVVMYEMATGVLPFTGDTALAVASKRLTDSAVPPTSIVPDLDPRWAHAIVRCLARDPAARFATANDVARAVTDEASDGLSHALTSNPSSPPGSGKLVSVSSGSGVAAPVALWRRPAVLTGIVGATGIAILAIALALPKGKPAAALSPPIPAAAPDGDPSRHSVAVVGFKNLTGKADAAWMSNGLMQMLSTELGAGEKMRVIPAGRLGGLAAAAAAAAADAAGTYTSMTGGSLRLDLKLQDARTGETIAAMTETGQESELPDLISRTGARLRSKLHVDELSQPEEAQVRGALAPSSDVLRLYVEGTSALREWSCDNARQALSRAVQLDPSFPLTHSALGIALDCLGHDEDARNEATKARDLSANLPDQIRMEVEARYYTQFAKLDKAREILEKLYHMFPDNAAYGLQLVQIQMQTGKHDEAKAILAELRKLPALHDHLDLDFAELHMVADNTQMLEEAHKVEAKARAQGVLAIECETGFLEVRTLVGLGRAAEALTLLDHLNTVADQLHDRDGRIEVAELRADILVFLGDVDGAQAALETGFALSKELHTERRIVPLDIHQAEVDLAKGDLRGAVRLLEDANRIAEQAGNRLGATYSSLQLVSALREEGELVRAQELLTKDIAEARDAHVEGMLAWSLREQGELMITAGDLTGAHTVLTEAHDIMDKGNMLIGQTLILLTDARLALAEGRPADAETLASSARTSATAARMRPYVAEAGELMAQAQLAQGKTAEASKSIALARPDAFASTQLSLDIDGLAAAHNTEALDDLAAHAAAAGFAGRALQARLAIAAATIADNKPAGRALLAALGKEARARGFQLLARRASALAQ